MKRLSAKPVRAKRGKATALPLAGSRLSAGFPSPADDYIEEKIDLNKLLIKNKPATYLMRVSGNSMQGAAICDGDILVIDASRRPRPEQIIVAAVDGEFLVKRWRTVRGKTFLVAENPEYPSREINPDDDFSIFGVVTGVVREIK